MQSTSCGQTSHSWDEAHQILAANRYCIEYFIFDLGNILNTGTSCSHLKNLFVKHFSSYQNIKEDENPPLSQQMFLPPWKEFPANCASLLVIILRNSPKQTSLATRKSVLIEDIFYSGLDFSLFMTF